MRRNDSLVSFVIRPKCKASFVSLRFTKEPVLSEYVDKRSQGLGCTKEAYLLALIRKDKAENGAS